MMEAIDGASLDRKLRKAGWNFFFIASEIKVTFLGAVGAKKIRSSLTRMLKRVSDQHFNGFEVTAIVAKHFLGVPYSIVAGHSRHLQKSCYLDADEERLLAGREVTED